MAATEVRKVGLAELRSIVVDAGELAKGTQFFDEKRLSNLSRHGNKLFCQAKGSSPYRVTLAFGDAATDVKSRCTCPAARASSRPFCKHGAALLVAWARAPEAFAVSDAPPEGAPGVTRKRAVKSGSASASELMKRG